MGIRSYYSALAIGILSLVLSGCVTTQDSQEQDENSLFGQTIDPGKQEMLGGLHHYLSQIQRQGNNGDKYAQRKMGDILLASGDNQEAMEWLKKAAANGDVDAQTQLGDEYFRGVKLLPDYAEAFKWYKQAAEAGNAHAQSQLASLYLNGRGTTYNLKQAIYWDNLAAEKGIAASQNNLGAAYTHGDGVPKNPETAVFWYTKAAHQGVIEAQFNLAGSYYLGQGVIKNYEQAYAWYATVSKYGIGDLADTARKMIDRLSPSLSKSGKYSAAKQLAEQYSVSYAPRKNTSLIQY
ncbi:MAG: sel1 repeat family protein [Enterobacteriaceae bacterium]|jgi:TPR repeat protein|nr:sel1 repeat family protein [Enterobacteriaceae bacterium]